MDHTLQPNTQPLFTVAHSDRFRKLPSIYLTGCSSLAMLLLLIVQTGCQIPSMATSALPVPPLVLNETAMGQATAHREQQDETPRETVRYQSPDSQDRFGTGPIANSAEPYQDTANDKSAPPVDRTNMVADVIIKGNKRIPTHHLTRNISTRRGRYFDPDKLQQDVDQLWRMSEINRINGPFLKRTPDGVIVTLEVVERNTISKIEFIGNRGISDRALQKETGLEDGNPLDVHEIRMAKTKIEEYYKDKGYPRTQVEIMEGNDRDDAKVTFLIHEDEKQRIWKAEFEGNTIATDARLRHFIKSKPGILKLVGGLVKRDEIEQDIVRLTTYYRNLGFFNAKIGRELSESNDGRWLTIRFIINEGPRYRVRNINFIGNQAYSSEQLATMLELKPNDDDPQPEFNVSKMNVDVVSLKDLYGSQGFVYADVVAEPRFLEEPGLLDLVYKIDEGKQYVVGEIKVHFEGDYGITQKGVVLNRLTLQPGSLIDVREIRNSERRLGAAQIFAAGGQPGAQPPRIVVRPPEIKALQRQAQGSGGSAYR